ncbi:MAG: uroporphyrinogen decarboxylase [Rhodospirillales bacterium]|nr:uroporphyrinogen decarboxylase [Rhodospirillales bacterium]
MNSALHSEKPFLAALAGKVATTPPIWLMRQAGRYLPEYKKLRAQSTGFLDFCFRPELAIEATLQPIRRFGLDAAILFSDILTVPWALGQKVEFLEGEGPKLEPLFDRDDVDRLNLEGLTERLSPVYRTVSGVASSLPAKTALIGFAGAPWTVAAYMVEGHGSRDFIVAKSFGLAQPKTFERLLEIVTTATIEHLSAQIEAGAEVVQLFDSWAGVLAEAEFLHWVIEPTRTIATALRARHPSIPLIGFPRGAGGLLPSYARETGVTALGLDTQVPLGWALDVLPGNLPVQGNLDPVALVVGGKALEDGTRTILARAKGRPVIFNLGHGVPQTTPPEHVAELVRLVRGG